jgi:acyl-CoA thioester hydrolase
LDVHGVLFTVRRLDLDLAQPARLDDALEIRTRIEAMTGARLRVRQEAWCGERRLAGGNLHLAVIGTDLRPRRLPADLTARLAAWVAPDPEGARGA